MHVPNATVELPLRWWFWFVLEHEIHHKAQLAVYLTTRRSASVFRNRLERSPGHSDSFGVGWDVELRPWNANHQASPSKYGVINGNAEGLLGCGGDVRLIAKRRSAVRIAKVTVRAPATARSAATVSVAGMAPRTRNCTTALSGVESIAAFTRA
jgi:hypothetical protein